MRKDEATVSSAAGQSVDDQDEILCFGRLSKSRPFFFIQDVESMVETMMQQLLSKEILLEPMKEIGQKYPKWLEEHESTLSKEQYDRCVHQYELIKNLNDVYETEPDNFTKIVDLMQKMQEGCQPPHDIVRDLAPEFYLSTLGHLSPEMLEVSAELLFNVTAWFCHWLI